jgi:type II secretion system protein G
MKNVKTSKGFTLIELLIVITIIGILAVALLPQVLGGPARARDAARKADLNAIVTALEQYAVDNDGQYPPNTAGVGCVDAIAALDTYFQSGAAPLDPVGGSKTYGGNTCATGSYGYCRTASNYVVAAIMENGGDNNNTNTAGVLPACATVDVAYTPAAGTAMYVLAR